MEAPATTAALQLCNCLSVPLAGDVVRVQKCCLRHRQQKAVLVWTSKLVYFGKMQVTNETRETDKETEPQSSSYGQWEICDGQRHKSG